MENRSKLYTTKAPAPRLFLAARNILGAKSRKIIARASVASILAFASLHHGCGSNSSPSAPSPADTTKITPKDTVVVPPKVWPEGYLELDWTGTICASQSGPVLSLAPHDGYIELLSTAQNGQNSYAMLCYSLWLHCTVQLKTSMLAVGQYDSTTYPHGRVYVRLRSAINGGTPETSWAQIDILKRVR